MFKLDEMDVDTKIIVEHLVIWLKKKRSENMSPMSVIVNQLTVLLEKKF